MPLLPIAPPVAVPGGGGFDYVTVDAARRRVYAAHGGASMLMIVDADTGQVLKQVKVGPMAGVAVNAANGHVFTGDGDDQAVSEVDPVTGTEIHRVAVAGHVDAIAYDAALGRIYADEDDGTRIFVIDAKTFKQIATVALPGHKPEYIQIDPKTHTVYQNIATDGEIAVVDPTTLAVSRTIPTPGVTNNHPLQYDAAGDRLMVGGDGTISVYTAAGKHLSSITGMPRIDQCDFDPTRALLACGGGSKITVLHENADGTMTQVASADVAPGVHTLAIDQKTGTIWAVWGTRGAPAGTGSFVQGFALKP
jgi:outer membrane protein assembly factor BamB